MKIKTNIISQFPFQVITEQQQATFLEQKSYFTLEIRKNFTIVLLVIDAYLYSSGNTLSLKSFNSKAQISELLTSVIAFIYTHIDGSISHKYNYSRYVITLMKRIADNASVTIEPPKLSKVAAHKEVQVIINTLSYINKNKLNFYAGWYIEDNKGIERSVALSFIREAYGDKVTAILFEALRRMCRKNKDKTVETHLKHFTGLFRYFIKLATSFKQLQHYLNKDLSVYYLSIIFNFELKEHIDAGLDGAAFTRAWSNKMNLFRECLIDSSIFDEPHFPLPVPRFKQSISLPGSHNDKEAKESSGIFNNKLVTKVPLKYNDNEAVREIIKDIRRDIDHVMQVSKKSSKLNNKRLERFKRKTQLAKPKELGDYKGDVSIDEKQNIACATFNHYMWDHPGKKGGYAVFLGYRDETIFLNRLLCIPTLHVLYPLILMLVHEHPKITESWLLNWQLLNERKKPYGYMQSGNSWVIRSVKKRIGMENAEQTITLNEISKPIVESILSHTKMAREYLKSKGSDDYRYALITGSVEKKPSKLNQITNLKKITSKSIFTKLLSSGSANVSNERAREIASLLTISRMRASTGVEIFLQTNSIKKMCEALGHKEPREDLVERYLPGPIQRFFQDRWILIFQNAIVFEAMKDSKYLNNAIDISPESLSEFLKNHQLKLMSGHIWDGNVFPMNVVSLQQEGAVVISTPLLRILLFFFSSSSEEIARIEFPSNVIDTWIQLATLIITQIEYQLTSSTFDDDIFDDEIIDMYNEAKDKPVKFSQFQMGVVHEIN